MVLLTTASHSAWVKPGRYMLSLLLSYYAKITETSKRCEHFVNSFNTLHNASLFDYNASIYLVSLGHHASGLDPRIPKDTSWMLF